LVLSLAALGFAGIPAEAQTTLPTTYAVPASAVDTSKKGILVRTWKSPGEPNTIAWAEEQLAGLHGTNTANTSIFTDNVYGNSYLDEAGPINYWNTGGEGSFPNDGIQNTPGLANDGSNDDSYSIEAFAILDLPAGTLTMAVNSDDGFRVNALQSPDPREQFGVTRLGQFDGGRGVADTTFQVVVGQAGLYPMRLIYEEGGGDSAVEWFTVSADGSKHLINDPADAASIKAYRMGTSPRSVVSKALPRPGSTGASPDAAIEAEIVDGSSPIDASTVKLSLDGTALAVTPAKSGSVTSAKYSPPTLFGSGTAHNVSLVYAEGGNAITQNWSFTVAVYASIPATAKVTPDTSKPGFVMNIFANSANTANSNTRTEASLNGLLLDAATGTPLPNLADPNAVGAALAASSAPNPANAPIKFEIAGVINLNQDAAGQMAGNFQPDLQFPGIHPWPPARPAAQRS